MELKCKFNFRQLNGILLIKCSSTEICHNICKTLLIIILWWLWILAKKNCRLSASSPIRFYVHKQFCTSCRFADNIISLLLHNSGFTTTYSFSIHSWLLYCDAKNIGRARWWWTNNIHNILFSEWNFPNWQFKNGGKRMSCGNDKEDFYWCYWELIM